jgi:hypothetical protein
MSTWNNITIETPGDLTFETLPEALNGEGSIWDSYDFTDERAINPAYVNGTVVIQAERSGVPDGSITIAGGSNYTADDAHEALLDLSRTTGTITFWESCDDFRESWDDDGGGRSVTVFRDGVEIADEAQCDALVPANLESLIAAVRAALPSPDQFDPNMSLSAAARTLVNALSPEVTTE